MKKHCLLYWGLICFLALMFTACMTAGIAKPEIPIKEQCIIVNRSYDTIKIGDITLGSSTREIVPAGMQRVSITRKSRYVVDRTETAAYITTTYFDYVQTWNCDYDFKPGKSYNITAQGAPLRYDGRQLTTNNPGVSIDASGFFVQITHSFGEDIEIIESNGGIGGGIAGSTFLGPYINGTVSIGLWDYGPSSLVSSAGPVFGFQLIHGKFGMILGGTMSGYIGLAFPEFDDFGVLLGYSYGGRAEFYYNKIGFGFGAGISNGGFVTFGEAGGDNFFSGTYSFPYAEFDFMFGKNMLRPLSAGHSIFIRYYFNDADKWHNKLAAGIKVRFN